MHPDAFWGRHPDNNQYIPKNLKGGMIMYKLKEKAKVLAAIAVPAAVAGSTMLVSFASEGGETGSVTESVTASLVSAVTDIASSIGGVIGTVIPIALPLIGAGLVVTIGIKVFKSVAGKAA